VLDFIKNYLGKGVFFLSLILFLVMQAYLIYAPIRARSLPIEPIVSYGYILKAEEMNSGCYTRDCPALVDLRRQFTERSSEVVEEFERAKGYARVIVLYHPLHSVILSVLQNIGLTYEKAFDLFAVVGTIFIHLGIAYWLFNMFGLGPTTIALLLLAPIVFPALGLHSIGPSNLSSGFCFFLWGIILDKKQRFTWALFPLLGAAILMHPIGKIYGLIALFLYFSTAERPLAKRTRSFLLGGVALIAFTFIAPIFIKWPELNAETSSWYPAEWNYLDYLLIAIKSLEHFVTFWASPVSIFGVILLLAFCLLKLRQRTGGSWLFMGGLLSGALFFSVIFLDPWWGPQLLERVWIVVGIFLTGALGLMLWYIARIVFTLGKRFYRQRNVKAVLSKGRLGLLHATIAISLLLLACRQAYINYFPYYFYSFGATINYQTDLMNFRLDFSQPNLIKQDISLSKEQTIIYMGEIQMYFYMTYGGLNYGSLYYPAIDSKQFDQDWLQTSLKQAAFLVGENPIVQLQNNADMEIDLDDNAQLGFEGVSNLSIYSFQAFIVHSGQPVELEIDWHAQSQIITTSKIIPANTSGWIDFRQNELGAEKVTIRLIGNRSVTIRGISFENQPRTNWPWEPGIRLTLTPLTGDASSIEISETSLMENLPLNIEVIDDDGFTILAKVIHDDQ